MTREEFMDIVYSELHSDGDNYRANRIIDAADEYAEAQTSWIPVSKRLPEEEEKPYWVCLDDGYQCECRWTNSMHGVGINEWDEWGWHMMDKPQYSRVVAWMPLPESYKPEERCGMTREEMIEQLENTILLIRQNGKDWWDERDIPILEGAIEALQTEPCEDAISRQAVLEKQYRIDDSATLSSRDVVNVEDIEDLPSVQPEPKVIRCKDCDEWHRGKNHNGLDIRSDAGYCSVYRTATSESYYCGDAERKKVDM